MTMPYPRYTSDIHSSFLENIKQFLENPFKKKDHTSHDRPLNFRGCSVGEKGIIMFSDVVSRYP